MLLLLSGMQLYSDKLLVLALSLSRRILDGQERAVRTSMVLIEQIEAAEQSLRAGL